MPTDHVPPRPGLPRAVQVARLRSAVRAERSWRGVMRDLGFTGSRTGRVLREVCDELGIDYGHFRLVGPDDGAFRVVIPAASTWQEALERLGYATSSGSARATVRKHCRRLGIDTSHLVLPSSAGDAGGGGFTPRPEHLRAAGPHLVAAALTLAGYAVSHAPEGLAYDLVVDMGCNGLRRVQVKTGTQRARGSWLVALKRTAYQSGEHRRAYYSAEDIDFFGCVDGSGDVYVIPISVVEGLTAISLRAYEPYRLRRLGDRGDVARHILRTSRDITSSG